jgi:hypothetical protein
LLNNTGDQTCAGVDLSVAYKKKSSK